MLVVVPEAHCYLNHGGDKWNVHTNGLIEFNNHSTHVMVRNAHLIRDASTERGSHYFGNSGRYFCGDGEGIIEECDSLEEPACIPRLPTSLTWFVGCS
jgi:hypothetical protein